jgi:hypothetical protein
LKKIRTLDIVKKGQIVSFKKGRDAKKQYEVINVRKLIPLLDEPKGYIVELEEIKSEQ